MPTDLCARLGLTRPIFAFSRIHRPAAAHPDDDHGLLMGPVGQIVGRMSEVRPVADLMDGLERQYADALSRLTCAS